MSDEDLVMDDASEDEGYDPDNYWKHGEHIDTCPWCGFISCGYVDLDGNLVCCVTKRIIP